MMAEHRDNLDHLPLHLHFIVDGLDKIIEHLQSSPDRKAALSTLVEVIEKTCFSQTRNVFLGPPDNPVGKDVYLKRFLQKFEPLLRVTWTKAELKQERDETAQEVVERFFHSAVAECASILYNSGSCDSHDLYSMITNLDNPAFITLRRNFEEFMASLHSQESVFNIASDVFLCESELMQKDVKHSLKESASGSIRFDEDKQDQLDPNEVPIDTAISELIDDYHNDGLDSVLPQPPAALFTEGTASSLSSPETCIQNLSLQDQSSLKESKLPLDDHSGNPLTLDDHRGAQSSDSHATAFAEVGTSTLPSSDSVSTGSLGITAPAIGSSCNSQEIDIQYLSLQDQSSLKVLKLPLDDHSGNPQTLDDHRGAQSSDAPATVFAEEGTSTQLSSDGISTQSFVGTAPANRSSCNIPETGIQNSSLQDQSSLKMSNLALADHFGNPQTLDDERGAQSFSSSATPSVFPEEGTSTQLSSDSVSTGSFVGTANANGCSLLEDTACTFYNMDGESQKGIEDVGGEYGAGASCIQSASSCTEEMGSPWTWESRFDSFGKDRQADVGISSLMERATAMRYGTPSECAVTIVKETGFFDMLLMKKLSGYMHPIIGITCWKGWLLVHFWEGESCAVDLCALSPGTKQVLVGPGAKFAGGTPDNIHKWAIIHSMGRVLGDSSILKVVYNTVDLSRELEENAGLKVVRVFDVLEADRIIRGHNSLISLAELLHVYGMVPYSSVDIVTGSQSMPIPEDIVDYCGKSQQEAINNLREMAQISMRMIPFLYQSMLSVMSAPMLSELNQRSNATVQSTQHSDYWYNPSEGNVISGPAKETPRPTSYADALVGMDKTEIAPMQQTPCFKQGTATDSKKTECERTEMQKQQREHQGETQEQKQQDALVGVKKKGKKKKKNTGKISALPLTTNDDLFKIIEESRKRREESRKWIKLNILDYYMGLTEDGSGAYSSPNTKDHTNSCKTNIQKEVKVKKDSLSGSSSSSNIKQKKSSESGASVQSNTQSTPSASVCPGVPPTKLQQNPETSRKQKTTVQNKPKDPQPKQKKQQPTLQKSNKVTDSVQAGSKKKKKEKSKSPQGLPENAAQKQTKGQVKQLKAEKDCKPKKASITSTTGQVKCKDPQSKQEKHQPGKQQNNEVKSVVEPEPKKKKKKKTKSVQELIVQNALKRLTGNGSSAETKDPTNPCKTDGQNNMKVKKSNISGPSSPSNIMPENFSITSATSQVNSKDPQSNQEKHQPAQQQTYDVNDSVEAESKKKKKSPEELFDEPSLIPQKEPTESEVGRHQQQPFLDSEYADQEHDLDANPTGISFSEPSVMVEHNETNDSMEAELKKKKKKKKKTPEEISGQPALIPEKEHTESEVSRYQQQPILHSECPSKEHMMVPNPSIIDCQPKAGCITEPTCSVKSPAGHSTPGEGTEIEQNQMAQPKVQNNIKPKDNSVSRASEHSNTQSKPPVIPSISGVGTTQNVNQIPKLKLQTDSKAKKSSITGATDPIKSKGQCKQGKQQPKQHQNSKGKDSTEAVSKKKKRRKKKKSRDKELKEAGAKKKKSQISAPYLAPQRWEDEMQSDWIKTFPEAKMSTSPLWMKPMVLQFQKDNNPIFIHPLTEQASIPINPCKITDELDEQFDNLLMSDVMTFVEAFPENLQLALEYLSEESFSYNYIHLAEVVLDVGRKPKARYLKSGFNSEMTEKVLNLGELSKQELKEILKDKSIVRNSGNQAMIRDTLHRIGLLANGQGEIIGMTAKVEHPLPGCLSPLYDVFNKGHSILVVGPPGVGKTTLLRETARVLSDLERKNVIVIDTFLELAGEGDIPHQSIGSARRLQVTERHLQPKMMKESYQNHRPDIVIIDELSSLEESKMALNMRLRGIQLIAGVNGQTLADVLLNAALAPITGGIKESCTVGQEAGGGGKPMRTRTGPPVFDVLVEMVERERWLIHWDFAGAIDRLLPGGSTTVEVEERFVEPEGDEDDDDVMLIQQVLAMHMPASYNYPN